MTFLFYILLLGIALSEEVELFDKGKTLIVFYSRTEMTKKVVDRVAQDALVKFGDESTVDLFRIFPDDDFSGVTGFWKLMWHSFRGKTSNISKHTPPVTVSEYDNIVIASPVHGWTMSSPIKTWLTENKVELVANKDRIKFFGIALKGESGDEAMFKDIEGILGVKLEKTLSVLRKDTETFSQGLPSKPGRLEEINEKLKSKFVSIKGKAVKVAAEMKVEAKEALYSLNLDNDSNKENRRTKKENDVVNEKTIVTNSKEEKAIDDSEKKEINKEKVVDNTKDAKENEDTAIENNAKDEKAKDNKEIDESKSNNVKERMEL